MSKRTAVAVTLALIMLVGAAVAQQTRRTETGDITADVFEWDLANNDFKATGNVVINIEGRHKAQLRAPAVSLDWNDNMSRIMRAVATGPVHLDLLTAPDNKGLQRRIVATCGGRATYEGATEIVSLTGGAEADVTTLPEGNVEAAHLKGDSITANLRESKISVKQAAISYTGEDDTEKDE